MRQKSARPPRHSDPSLGRVERVAQAVADEVDAEHDQRRSPSPGRHEPPRVGPRSGRRRSACRARRWRLEPKPRNDSAASVRIAVAIISVALTMIGPMAFGRMCRKMIRRSPEPAAFAASTYSFSRSDRKMPRTIRAMLRPEQQREDDRDAVAGRRCPNYAAATSRTASGGSVRKVGEAHEQVVEPAAVVAGERADRGSRWRSRERRRGGRPAQTSGCRRARG